MSLFQDIYFMAFLEKQSQTPLPGIYKLVSLNSQVNCKLSFSLNESRHDNLASMVCRSQTPNSSLQFFNTFKDVTLSWEALICKDEHYFQLDISVIVIRQKSPILFVDNPLFKYNNILYLNFKTFSGFVIEIQELREIPKSFQIC